MRFIVSLCALLVAYSVAASPYSADGNAITISPVAEGQTIHLQEDGTSIGAAIRSQEVSCDCKGRVNKKIDASGNVEEFIYHPRTGKLILVLGGGKRSSFHYNDGGKLIRAKNSDGQLIDISYNRRGLVKTIYEMNGEAGSRRILRFKYQTSDKPVEIHLVGVGRITVTYDANGEISGVRSKGGTKMAIEVTAAFQALKNVIRGGGLK
jgi:hypothetical protein